MSTSSCPVNLTAQSLRGSGSWVLCQAQWGGWGGGRGRQAKYTVCVRERAPACDRMCDRLARACVRVHACQDEGMDACQRREQHHVRVLADDAHFRYTNSNSQLSHETISSHDSPHSLPVCLMWFSTRCTVIPPSKWVRISHCLRLFGDTRKAPSRSQLIWVLPH